MIVTEKQLREILRKQCKEAETQKAWAKSKGVLPSQVSEVLTGRRPFTATILKALKAKQIKNYEVPVLKFEDIE